MSECYLEYIQYCQNKKNIDKRVSNNNILTPHYNNRYANNNYHFINGKSQQINQNKETENLKSINNNLNNINGNQNQKELNSNNYVKFIMNERKQKRAPSPYIYYSPPPQQNNKMNNNILPYIPKTSSFTTPNNQSLSTLPLRSFHHRINEITNPEMYYKLLSKEYLYYKEQHHNYSKSNYQLMINNQSIKKEIPINPYNFNSSLTVLGNSNLHPNPILNPLPHFHSNKYIIPFSPKLKRSSSSFFS